MSQFDTCSDQQRRRLAHVYAALQNHIGDELEYDFGPDVPPLDENTSLAAYEVIHDQLTALMVAAHAEEAAAIQAKMDAYWADVAWRGVHTKEEYQ